MLLDLAAGMFLYFFISIPYGQQFNGLGLFVAIICAYFPDADIPIFALGRKKFNWVSHHFIHYPLIILPIGTILIFFFGPWLARLFGIAILRFPEENLAGLNGTYLAGLFFAGNLWHFFHDSLSQTGIKWFWPFVDTPYKFESWSIVSATESRERQYAKYRPGIQERTFWQEIKYREKLEAEEITMAKNWQLIFLFMAMGLNLIYFMIS